MKYLNQYIELQDRLWQAFEKLVQKGAHFPELIEVTYPFGSDPFDRSQATGGESWFLAKEIVANPSYQLHCNDNLLISAEKVTFIDVEGNRHTLEPDDTDMLWLAQLLDGAGE